MNTLVISGLIGGFASAVVAWISGRATVKSASTSNEGIYAKELPELLEQIKQLNIERQDLSQELLTVRMDNQKLLAKVGRLSDKIDRMNQLLKKNGVEIHED